MFQEMMYTQTRTDRAGLSGLRVYGACAETRASGRSGQGARSEEKLTAATADHEETSRCRWRIIFTSVLSVTEDVSSVVRNH